MSVVIGEKRGKITIVECVGKNKWNSKMYLCQCDCGNKKVIAHTNLVAKKGTKSCGCLVDKPQKTHGMSNTILYSKWRSMLNRCKNENMDSYPDYGGRGITVCEEWMKFESFSEWALSNGYVKGLTIDRIDVNGNYEPENCRWVDIKTQNRNKRDSINVEMDGGVFTLKELADKYGFDYSTLRLRYHKGLRGLELIKPKIMGGNLLGLPRSHKGKKREKKCK